ncbi:hypothetical protein [Knoellia sinensis]|uniref:hypothetical protein n=1 Tax=Knoellia sinensis TaxID=136100 RepID=UPI0012EC1DBC|nr:hypothetical protein [Knoellia sinensis]
MARVVMAVGTSPVVGGPTGMAPEVVTPVAEGHAGPAAARAAETGAAVTNGAEAASPVGAMIAETTVDLAARAGGMTGAGLLGAASTVTGSSAAVLAWLPRRRSFPSLGFPMA